MRGNIVTALSGVRLWISLYYRMAGPLGGEFWEGRDGGRSPKGLVIPPLHAYSGARRGGGEVVPALYTDRMGSDLVFQKSAQASVSGGMPQLLQRTGFDLANPFSTEL